MLASHDSKNHSRDVTYEAVVMERDLARTLSGKISPVTTQATGPQEQAKKKM